MPEIVTTVTTSPTTAAPSTTAPPSTAAPTTPTTLAPARKPIVIGFAGDTSFTAGLEQRDPFGAITDLLSEPDLMVLNLETAIADPGVGRPPVQKQFLFRSPPESLQLLVNAGVDVVTLANNHTLDYGADALAQTLEEIDATPLLRVGAGLDEAAAYQPLIVEVGEWTVGLVSLSRVPCDWSASGANVRPQVAWACPPFAEKFDALVRRTVDESDVAVVLVHGGTEGVLCPSGFMVELEQHWAELGVDVVVDGHPHVMQGITSVVRQGKPDTMVVHSTGNFAFPSANGLTANTAVFSFTITEETESRSDSPVPEIALQVHPLRSPSGVLGYPTDAQHAAMINQINGVSEGWYLQGDGTAVQDDEHHAAC